MPLSGSTPAKGTKRSGWRSASPATSSFGMNVSCTLDHSSKPVISDLSMPASSSSAITLSSDRPNAVAMFLKLSG